MRRLVIAGTIAVLIVAAWALTNGPLQGSAIRMDDVWLQAVASKDSLFPNEWPLWAWVGNLGVFAVLVLAHRYRRSSGLATPQDTALVWGATALVAVFLITLPQSPRTVAFAVQFQVSRVFWLVDFLATVYVISAISTSQTMKVRETRAVVLARCSSRYRSRAALTSSSSNIPERTPVRASSAGRSLGRRDALGLAPTAERVRPRGSRPCLEVRHQRAGGSRAADVFMEDVKDSAIAMYSRDVAVRGRGAHAGARRFHGPDAGPRRELATEYDLDVSRDRAAAAVSQVAYRNSRFGIYRLR
jgi:hypothetical protein